jgi:hypothetical protein
MMTTFFRCWLATARFTASALQADPLQTAAGHPAEGELAPFLKAAF